MTDSRLGKPATIPVNHPVDAQPGVFVAARAGTLA
jgi:hypothetical protein